MGNLTAKQRRAIEAMASGENKEQTAVIAGVSRQSLYNWFKLPHFRNELIKTREEFINAGVSRLVGRIDLAVDILSRGAEGTPPVVTSDQIRSANYLLNHTRAFTEMAHFGERLEQAIADIEELKQSSVSETQTPNRRLPVVPGDDSE